MCGRYTLFNSESLLTQYFDLDDWPEFSANYNIAPSLSVPIIRQSPQGKRVAHLLRWGLIPHQSRDPAIGQKLNNARAETVTEKPSFRAAYRQRRCLIPASGYYEWQEVAGAKKQPWYIQLKGEKEGTPMAMGGLWESWTNPEGEIVRTFCVITTSPNEVMRPIHERMPVIIPKPAWTTWLNPRFDDAGAIASLLAPYDASLMEARPVSRRVSNAREQGPELIVGESAGN